MKQDFVRETVLKWLAEGRYQPGDQLPTDAELAKIFQINRSTVGTGLRQLAGEGILERAPRRGTIVKRPDSTIPITNAVALIAVSEGEVYGQLVREINRCLCEKGLYPVLINSDLANDSEAISAFLTRMNRKSRPYGYLILGESNFPYELLMKKPYLQSNIVFFLRYHWYEKYSYCKYALADYAALGRQVVEYFAEKGIKQIFFPAWAEKGFCGEWSSMQVTIMQSIKENAEKCGLRFDEGLFWRTHSGAPLEAVLPACWNNGFPAGFYTWLDSQLCNEVMPLLQKFGKVRGKDYEFLGTFNTKRCEKHRIDSFDFRVEEIAKSAVELLVSQDDRKEILLPPSLILHSNKQKDNIQQTNRRNSTERYEV